jgi:hypothetical protein
MRQRAHPTNRVSRHPSRRPDPHVVDLTGSDEPAGSDTTDPVRRSPSPEVLFISSRPRPQSRPSPQPRNNARRASRPSRRSIRANNVQQPGATFADLMEDLLRPAPQIPVLPCAPPGFTSSPGPDDTIVCPKCMHELCSGRTEEQRQVWVIKACGHVSYSSPLSTNERTDVDQGVLRLLHQRTGSAQPNRRSTIWSWTQSSAS